MRPPLDPFTRAYLEAALWSSTDESTPEGGEPMDANYSIDDIAPEAIDRAVADCLAFQAAHGPSIDDAPDASRSGEWDNREMAGHDFWLTRNGHGAGFWDGDWPEPLATVLTDAAHAFGELSPYVGDDGLIYL
jgi:hypothetical protein